MRSPSVASISYASELKISNIRLARLSAFNNTQSSPWQQFLPQSQIYPMGTELFSQESKANEVYFLEDGFAKLVWINPSGRELIVGLRHLPCFLGLASAILGVPHPTSAVTVAKSKLARVPADFLLDLMSKNQEISGTIAHMLSSEVCEQTERLTELGSLSSSQRVKHILYQIVGMCEKKLLEEKQEIRLMLPLKQCEIASVLAMTPEHLSRVLKHLCKQGIIRWHKGWLVVPDISRLQ